MEKNANAKSSRISIFALIACMVLLVAVTAAALKSAEDYKSQYVRGEFGSKCYETGKENRNIRYPQYYQTYEDCLRSIK